jgi:hypothetical protein
VIPDGDFLCDLDTSLQKQRSSLMLPSTITEKLNELTTLTETVQKFVLACAGFLTVGIGAVLVAWTKIRQQLAAVETQVSPVKSVLPAEIPLAIDDTLRQKVDDIVANVDKDKIMRDSQHAENKAALAELKDTLADQNDELAAIRSLVQKVLAKMAGL